MPRRIGDQLTGEQRQVLLFGILLRGGPWPFDSEEAAAAAWQRHGAELMVERPRPGWRPWGFWRYQIGLTPDPGGEFRWRQIGAYSEEHACWRDYADAAERATIEAEWLRTISSAAIGTHRDPLEYLSNPRELGIPLEILERYLPGAIASARAEREAFRESVTAR
jgi:hypothetical protein